MKIAIIGNGPSRELYAPDNYDVVVGCNLPPEGVHIDYCAIADAKCIMLAYRQDARWHDRLKEYKLVIGPRCAHGIKGCKIKPGDPLTIYQFLKENDHIHQEIPLWPDANNIGQRYFSTGHLAFAFVNNEWENAEIHLYGFDSLFTGHQESLTDIIYSKPVTKRPKGDKYNRNSPVNTVGEWYRVWEKLLDSPRNKASKIYIHGYKGDINDYFKKHMEVINHDKQIL